MKEIAEAVSECICSSEKENRKVYASRRHNGSLFLKRQLTVAAFKGTTHRRFTYKESALLQRDSNLQRTPSQMLTDLQQ